MKQILDVSSIIYGGHNGVDRRIKGFPVGGIRKLFGIINAGLSRADFALCFDGGEIIKKELLPSYKAGRIPDYSVLAQIDLAKTLLTECDIPFYQDPKYEADDFVYSICSELDMLGDADEIVIFSDDRDLSCCVTENISIRNVTSNGICIDRNNFSDRVVKGTEIPFNTILLWKVFHGDPSDNYKALHVPGVNFDLISKVIVEEFSPLVGPDGFSELAYSNFDVFCKVLDLTAETLPPGSLEQIKAQARIAFPYLIPVSDASLDQYREEFQGGEVLYVLERKHMKVFGNGNFNRKKFDFYCTLLGLNQTRLERRVDKDSEKAQEFYRLLELRAKELASGAMAVERYRKKRAVKETAPSLANMELPI